MESPRRKAPSKRAQVTEWIASEAPARIGEAEWDSLRAKLGKISTGYLRTLLRESGVPLAPLVEGVRQEDFESLERSLLALLAEYERGDRTRQREARQRVIEAKDGARWAVRREERRTDKEEMVLWMVVWLENPGLFPQWVRLRRAARQQHGGT